MLVPSRALDIRVKEFAESRSVQLVRVASILATFFLLHLVFSQTAPLSAPEALARARITNGAVPWGAFSGWIALSDRFDFGLLGTRALPLILQAATGAVVMRLIWIMNADGRAVELGGVWLNVTLLSGLGGVFAIEANAAAFFLTASVLALLEARARDDLKWLAAFAGLLIATVWTDPRLMVCIAGLACVRVPDLGARTVLWRKAYMLGLASAAFLGIVRFWLAQDLILPHFARLTDFIWVATQFGVIVLLITPGLCGFLGIRMLHAAKGAKAMLTERPFGLRPPHAVLGSILVLWMAAGIPLDLALVAMPLIIVLAAGPAIHASSFAQRRWVMLATPIALGLHLLAVGVTLHPPRVALNHVAPIGAMFGWADFAPQIAARTHADGLGWIVAQNRQDAALIAAHAGTIPVSDLSGDLAAKLRCDRSGHFVVAVSQEAHVLEHFAAFRRIATLTRRHRGQTLAIYGLYEVAQPTNRAICQQER